MRAHLAHLVELAKDPSLAARRRLVADVAEVFLNDHETLSDVEAAIMSDVLSQLIAHIERDLKSRIAERLADVTAPMEALAGLLADDVLDVSRPLLARSPLLSDQQLIDLVAGRSPDHRLIIAGRPALSADLAQALVDYGEPAVIERLLANERAELSAAAFEFLVSESRRYNSYQGLLLDRDDLPAQLAHRMYWWVSHRLRETILSRFAAPEEAVSVAVTDMASIVELDDEREAGANTRAQQAVKKMRAAGNLTLQFLINALREQRVEVFIAGLAELTGCDYRTVWRAYGDRTGQSLAVICRAAGAGMNDFKSMFLLLAHARDGGAQAGRALDEATGIFAATTPAVARTALAAWADDMSFQMAPVTG